MESDDRFRMAAHELAENITKYSTTSRDAGYEFGSEHTWSELTVCCVMDGRGTLL